MIWRAFAFLHFPCLKPDQELRANGSRGGRQTRSFANRGTYDPCLEILLVTGEQQDSGRIHQSRLRRSSLEVVFSDIEAVSTTKGRGSIAAFENARAHAMSSSKPLRTSLVNLIEARSTSGKIMRRHGSERYSFEFQVAAQTVAYYGNFLDIRHFGCAPFADRNTNSTRYFFNWHDRSARKHLRWVTWPAAGCRRCAGQRFPRPHAPPGWGEPAGSRTLTPV